MRPSRSLLIAVLVASASAAVLLLFTSVPLGVPGEWTWDRIVYGDDLWIDLAFSAVTVTVLGAGYLAFVWYGARGIASTTRWGLASRLTLLAALGFAWLWTVQSIPPPLLDLSKSTRVLYDPAASGYFHEACYGDWTTGEFLAGYEARMREGDVLHVGTHPPGLFLVHRAVITSCRRSRTLVRWIDATRPTVVLAVDSKLLTRIPPYRLARTDSAALWLATLLTNGIGVLTVVPLFFLVSRTSDRRTAWLAAAFWPLVPSLAVFLPKSDALFPFVATVFLLAWLEASRRRSLVLAGFAAIVLWCGLWLSLAFAPVALLAAVLSLGETLSGGLAAERVSRLRRLAMPVAVGATAFVGLTLLTWWSTGVNLFVVWWWNLRNHASFYERFTRTYSSWLVVNPIEMAFAIGMPLAVLATVGLVRSLRSPAVRDDVAARWVPWACAGVWGLLWLSGKNSGEAARLWLVLAPWPIWTAFAAGLGQPRANGDAHRGASGDPIDVEEALPRFWLVVLAVQAVTSALTVAGVTGFSVPGA